MLGALSFKSVGVKLFVIFLVSITLFASAVGVFAYNTSKSLVKDEVGTFTTMTTVEAADKLRMVYQNYERMLLRLMVEPQFKDAKIALEEALAGDDLQLRGTAAEDYKKLIQSFANADKHMKSIKVIETDGKLVTSIGSRMKTGDELVGSEKAVSKDNDFDYREIDWYQAAIERNGDPVWIPTRLLGMVEDGVDKPSFGISRAVKDNVTGEIDYVLLLEVHYAALQEPLNSLKLQEGSSKLIVNSDNMVVYSDNLEQVAQPSPLAYPVKEGEANGSEEVTEDGVELLISYASSYTGNDWTVVTAIPTEQLTQNASVILDVLVIVLAVGLVFAVLIGIYMILSIGRPLQRMQALMARGEQGELSVRSNIRRRDEIGQLGESFNNMMEQITHLVKQVDESVSLVKQNADEVNTVSRDNAVIAQEVASSMEEIAKGASELATQADEGYESAGVIRAQMESSISANREMGATAHQVLEMINAKGVAGMTALLEKTRETEEKTQTMFAKVDALKASTSSIRSILDLLDGITKQTNILSLNASIEAARAGEAGKGFMVVANEIRKLADQSRESIEVVGSITEKIESEAGETIEVLEAVKPIYEQQLRSVDQTDQVLKEVQHEMVRFIAQLDEVTASIEQLGQSQKKITDSITSVSAVAEESSATTQEVASLTANQLKGTDELLQLSDKLKALSDSLEDSLRKFKY